MVQKLKKWSMNNADVIVALIASIIGSIIVIPMIAHADYSTLVDGVVSIVCAIVQVVGVIFGIVGIVKFVIAHANEQGGDQQRAALMIATGIVLVAVPAIVKGIPWSSMIDEF